MVWQKNQSLRLRVICETFVPFGFYNATKHKLVSYFDFWAFVRSINDSEVLWIIDNSFQRLLKSVSFINVENLVLSC